MARSDLIINLVKAGVKGDTADARAIAEAIAADERGKKHTGIAERITRALEQTTAVNGNGQARQAQQPAPASRFDDEVPF